MGERDWSVPVRSWGRAPSTGGIPRISECLTALMVSLAAVIVIALAILAATPHTATTLTQDFFTLVKAASAPVSSSGAAKGANAPAATTGNASKALVRIGQLDPGQYASAKEYNDWASSTCSAAAMTEVINAYGNHYRITDILQVEYALGEITPDLGLLEPTGIDRTVAQFGFKAVWLTNASLDEIITVANQGRPVIVNWPPERWKDGHILVVRGGNAHDVYLADSSRLNYQIMARSRFMQLWAGFAVVVTPRALAPSATHLGPYEVLGKPTLTVDFMNQVLASYHSPAAGKAQGLYDLGVKYDIDPAFALAFFLHESTLGTAGEARTTLSLGNLRCIPNADCVDQDRGGYASFPTWESGFEAWYKLIRTLYIAQWGLVTVDQIIPKYAPTSDNNDEQGYINSLKHSLDVWHSGQLRP